MVISSKEQLEKAAVHFGMLPFFANKIPGFSVEELAAPGKLFGETNEDYGCWEWKGPVIQEQTTAYGKFFNRKAGFVATRFLPDFINYRRNMYPVETGSLEEKILEIVRSYEGITSTELKKLILDSPSAASRKQLPLMDALSVSSPSSFKVRKSIEGPLTRLQMGTWLLIADFEYKFTARGDRYGWGVALYSTPEIWFNRDFRTPRTSAEESFDFLCRSLSDNLPGTDFKLIKNLIS